MTPPFASPSDLQGRRLGPRATKERSKQLPALLQAWRSAHPTIASPEPPGAAGGESTRRAPGQRSTVGAGDARGCPEPRGRQSGFGGLQGRRAPLRDPGPAACLPGRRAGGRAGRPRERGAAKREGRCAAQKLHSSPILGSAGLLAAAHSLSAARAAPGALIGSQPPGAGADQLMHAWAPPPLGERQSGHRRGGGARAGKERKGKGPGGRGCVGEGSRGRAGRRRADRRVPARKDPACPGCRSPPRADRGPGAVPSAPTPGPERGVRSTAWPPPPPPSGWIALQARPLFSGVVLQTPRLPKDVLIPGNVILPFVVKDPPALLGARV